ncbi:MAG: hypothetical protein LBD24_08765 [Spirochaetaceae bacterium]|nr:hypothetical protein [Spirochaetaceae bacterium]
MPRYQEAFETAAVSDGSISFTLRAPNHDGQQTVRLRAAPQDAFVPPAAGGPPAFEV